MKHLFRAVSAVIWFLLAFPYVPVRRLSRRRWTNWSSQMFYARAIAVMFVLWGHLGLLAQAHSSFPVEIVPGPAPQPVISNGRLHLLYELHLTNVAPIPVELVGLEVYAENASVPLASYRGAALSKMFADAESL